MRKPITIVVLLLALGCLVYAAGRILTRADGPCAPKEPDPKGVG
jgi:hypothetical protein